MMKRIHLCLVLCALAVLVSGFGEAAGKPAVQWKTYAGAWFEILYPQDFKVKPSQKDRNNPAAYSSVFFTSPDGQVEFYVLSPKYGMEPVDVAWNRNQENKISSSKKNTRGIIFEKTTVNAKDGSYMRLIEDYTDTTGTNIHTRRVFAIKYRDQDMFDKVHKLYKEFKNSLMEKRD